MNKSEAIGVGTGIVYILIMALGMFTMHRIFGYSYDSPKMVKILVYFELVMSLLVLLVYKYLKLDVLTTKFVFSNWLWPFLIAFILMLTVFIFTGNFLQQFPLIALVGLTTLLVGFSEEMMFRGILLHVLRERHSLVFAIIASSLFFAFLHSVNVLGGVELIGMVMQLGLTFLSGLIFSCFAILIKNITPIITYHFVWDFVVISQPLTGAKTDWLSATIIILEVIIVIPLFIYTIRYHV